MQTFLIIVIVVLALALWLLFVYHRAYAKEAKRIFHKQGYDQYAYTNDWWITDRDSQSNARIAGPFSSAQDAGKVREILERYNKSDINYWVQRIAEGENA